MHTISDEANGLFLNHSAGWIGHVRIAWRPEAGLAHHDVPSMRECWCDGPALVAGRFMPEGGPAGTVSSPPPVDVMTRAVALAVESYLRTKLETQLDQLFIPRGKL